MYFIPRNNKFYSLVAHLRSFHRYLLTFLIISFIFILWFTLVYRPLTAHINYAIAQHAQLRKQCQQIEKAKRNCQQLQQSLQTFTHTQVNKPEKASHNSLQSSLLLILDYAKKSGLTLNKYTMDKEVEGQFVIKNSAHFSFTGNLPQIINFLKQLKETACLFGYDHFSLKKVGKDAFQLTIIIIIISSSLNKETPSTWNKLKG